MRAAQLMESLTKEVGKREKLANKGNNYDLFTMYRIHSLLSSLALQWIAQRMSDKYLFKFPRLRAQLSRLAPHRRCSSLFFKFCKFSIWQEEVE
eukprot:scaffold26659_cov225-Skeletonema_menzelii.AAC.2